MTELHDYYARAEVDAGVLCDAAELGAMRRSIMAGFRRVLRPSDPNPFPIITLRRTR